MHLSRFMLPAILLVAGAACGQGASNPPASGRPETVNPAATPARIGIRYDHTLDIHCGVWGTTFDDSAWDADPVIDDGSSNPRPEWRAEDEQDGEAGDSIVGSIRLEDKDVAIFESRGGLVARFIRRSVPPPADEVCE